MRRGVCGGCPVLCDDVRFADPPAGDGPPDPHGACDWGSAFLSALLRVEARPMLGGQPADRAAALAAAAELLRSAGSPAVIGLTGLTVEALREAVPLAETLRGLLAPWPPDPTRNWGHAAPDIARTWGAIADAAELAVFWGADPDQTHPRLRERLRLTDERTLVLPGEPDVATAVALRMHFEKAGPPVAALSSRLAAVRSAHIFLTRAAGADAVLVGQLQLLAARLLPVCRLSVGVLPDSVNARGATEVLTWQTGFPGPTGFAGGAPQYRPGVWEADRILADGLADAVVTADLDADTLPAEARSRLARTRRIVISPREDPSADVCFVIPGLDPRLDAHVVRPDGIMLRLAGAGPGFPDPAAEVLADLRRALA
jgi:formylmethanofuran dehydrogenase subunit B